MSTGQGAARLTAQLSAHRVVLIRHAEPEIEPAIPAAEWRLSAAGREAAESLAGSLSEYSFERVTSSPEPKALETAQAIAAKLGGLPVDVQAGFCEHARRSA
ncbi:MAG: histidine phosphatase family protein, partial [Steroidobacteraceae bacterium]